MVEKTKKEEMGFPIRREQLHNPWIRRSTGHREKRQTNWGYSPSIGNRVYKENKKSNSSRRNWFTCEIRHRNSAIHKHFKKATCIRAARTKRVGLRSVLMTRVLNERNQKYLCKVSLF